MSDSFNYVFKIIVIGNTSVGKTSILNFFLKNQSIIFKKSKVEILNTRLVLNLEQK
jgi:GTPase SAR1 family protein